MAWYFVFFFVSGFCSILYELIWLRSAMAHFGVTTAMVSLVLSAFMTGLGLGCWGSGSLVRKYEARIHFPPLRLYALTELLIGIAAVTVPLELAGARELLQRTNSQIATSSSGYYLAAGVLGALILVPWCACMGATFPFAMFAIRRTLGSDSSRSFSYLYLANVLGAVAGASIPLALIEWLGFHRTLYVGATLNFLLASAAFALTLGRARPSQDQPVAEPAPRSLSVNGGSRQRILWVLFGTGFTSMGAEVVWIRLYTPWLGTVVYAFAAILVLYLLATYTGSWLYRRRGPGRETDRWLWWLGLAFSAVLPLVSSDPELQLPVLFRVIVGVAPLSCLVGFVTPMLVDHYSWGDPDRAGGAYAINIIGCVLGPLISGFLLLPSFGEKLSLCLFGIPWFLAGGVAGLPRFRQASFGLRAATAVLVVGSVGVAVFAGTFEEQFPGGKVLRDSTATVIASGSGFDRQLLVNGVGMTGLTPITKMMAHLPLAFLSRPPENVLVICFGMGTSHRSALSWHVHSSAVELVPSVPRLFSYYHSDAPKLEASPLSRIIIDDGRSYLKRSPEHYDVILLDPPPPPEAAGSSLLYSTEFYALAKPHLRPGGILQQWFPGGDSATTAAVARALQRSFPHVRVFRSFEHFGYHFLASMSAIPDTSAPQLAARLPADAVRDLMEWGPESTPERQFQFILDSEVPLANIIQMDPEAPALQDDRPINEYFLARRWGQQGFLAGMIQDLLGPSAPD